MVEARTIQLHVGCVLLDATVFRSHAAAMHAEEIIEHVHDATKAVIHRQMLRWFADRCAADVATEAPIMKSASSNSVVMHPGVLL
uniref:Uncharacterized protein n=1 Tax=Ascaris lumbricoides TaxID=6252 RepID=A0A0M3HTG7_ASCLU